MTQRQVTRRAAMAASSGLGVALLAGLGSTPSSARKRIPQLRLDDPTERARIRAKVSGSIAAETVYTFCRLHLYLWLNDGNLMPMVTMANLNDLAEQARDGVDHASVLLHTAGDIGESIQQVHNMVRGTGGSLLRSVVNMVFAGIQAATTAFGGRVGPRNS